VPDHVGGQRHVGIGRGEGDDAVEGEQVVKFNIAEHEILAPVGAQAGVDAPGRQLFHRRDHRARVGVFGDRLARPLDPLRVERVETPPLDQRRRD
jgi:hypothetical protein